MASLRDLLRRFRPVAAPGPATPAGAPADRAAERSSELAPVFLALAEAEAEAESIREAGAREAEHRREAARAEAQRLLAEARERAAAERALAATERLRGADQARDALLDEASKEAAQIGMRAAERMPALIEILLARVRSTGSDDAGTSDGEAIP